MTLSGDNGGVVVRKGSKFRILESLIKMSHGKMMNGSFILMERRKESIVCRNSEQPGAFVIGSSSGVIERGLLSIQKFVRQLLNLGSLKLAMVGVFPAQKSMNTTNQYLCFLFPLRIVYQHTTATKKFLKRTSEQEKMKSP